MNPPRIVLKVKGDEGMLILVSLAWPYNSSQLTDDLIKKGPLFLDLMSPGPFHFTAEGKLH